MVLLCLCFSVCACACGCLICAYIVSCCVVFCCLLLFGGVFPVDCRLLVWFRLLVFTCCLLPVSWFAVGLVALVVCYCTFVVLGFCVLLWRCLLVWLI